MKPAGCFDRSPAELPQRATPRIVATPPVRKKEINLHGPPLSSCQRGRKVGGTILEEEPARPRGEIPPILHSAKVQFEVRRYGARCRTLPAACKARENQRMAPRCASVAGAQRRRREWRRYVSWSSGPLPFPRYASFLTSTFDLRPLTS